MPMIVDSIGPKISDIKVTPKNGKYEVSWNAEDNASDYNSAVIYVNGVAYTPSLEAKSQIVNTEPKSIVILGIDYAGNVSWTTWGDPSYIKYTMAIQTWNVSPTVGVNQNKPAKINGYAYNRGDWTINVKNSSGQIVETSYLKNEHTLHANWVPDKILPNGTYSITLDLVTKDGFKVTSTPKTVTVVQ
ncbi:hypothetical protein [Bacillus sp. AFS053548]|uniref:hypothetical protein n=1 Tax=Bacillus sp. AFS053548 TaxID=2033505 RepID=UPI0025707EF4|nr:hypothetical protein [Bacillus sp. AFS053548]